MTYKELKAHIEVMDEEQQNSDVTTFVYIIDEYLPVHGVEIANNGTCDVLDENHPFLVCL